MPRERRSQVAPLRVELLAERVRWLDRYRRTLSLLIGAGGSLLLRDELTSRLDSDWPLFHTVLMTAVFGAVVWLLAEIGLAYVTALWETEEYRLACERGLPRATLLPVRRSLR